MEGNYDYFGSNIRDLDEIVSSNESKLSLIKIILQF